MQNSVRTLCLTAAIMTGLATEGYAANDHKHGPRINFEEVDTNADGLLSTEELKSHREARFAATDTDGSGALSREEIEARMRLKQDDRRARFLDRMFERRDANADGQLTLDEMADGRTAKMFERADANGDGQISKAEFEAVAEKGRGAKDHAQ